jgi:DNA-binding CsgD family transcriptional regulator
MKIRNYLEYFATVLKSRIFVLIMLGKNYPRSNPISDGEILAMIEAVLPLLYDNPDGIEITARINKLLKKIIPYDFCHYLMDAQRPEPVQGPINMIFEKWGNDTSSFALQQSSDTLEEFFEDAVEQNYQSAMARLRERRPEILEYHYHRIESQTYPKIILGFLRFKETQTNNAFTTEEKNIFDRLAPHLILLFRMALTHASQSQAFHYFDGFSKLSSKLAIEHGLSASEVRLIPDILFGYNNKEIAEKNFISVDTVKSHIKHILKKTETKNRIDFISKFFTSPDHVQL